MSKVGAIPQIKSCIIYLIVSKITHCNRSKLALVLSVSVNLSNVRYGFLVTTKLLRNVIDTMILLTGISALISVTFLILPVLIIIKTANIGHTD